MRAYLKQTLGVLAITLMAVPVWARPDTARTDVATWNSPQTTMIATTELKPGAYELRARETENQLEVLQDGKVVAQVPCHWIQLPKKAADTEITTDRNQIVQVQFAGRTEAIQLN